MIIILLNGPPQSGKDTITKIIKKKVYGCKEYKMSRPIKAGINAMFAISYDDMKMLEGDKDSPWDIFNDRSYREAQISLSEDWLKPNFRDDILGHIACKSIRQIAARVVVCDVGFDIEVQPLRVAFPKQLKGISVFRPGHTFLQDSRELISFGKLGIPHATVDNKYDLDLLEIQVDRALKKLGVIDE